MTNRRGGAGVLRRVADAVEAARAGRRRRGLWSDQRGLTTVEFTVLFVVISIGTLTLWTFFAPELAGVFGPEYAERPKGQRPEIKASGGSSSSSGGGLFGLGNLGNLGTRGGGPSVPSFGGGSSPLGNFGSGFGQSINPFSGSSSPGGGSNPGGGSGSFIAGVFGGSGSVPNAAPSVQGIIPSSGQGGGNSGLGGLVGNGGHFGGGGASGDFFDDGDGDGSNGGGGNNKKKKPSPLPAAAVGILANAASGDGGNGQPQPQQPGARPSASASTPTAASGPYAHLEDHPSVGPGKNYTQAQKKKFLADNAARNGGVLRDDETGEELVPPQQSKKGVTPPANEAQIDHNYPRSAGGPNSADNARVRGRQNNIDKSNKIPPGMTAPPPVPKPKPKKP